MEYRELGHGHQGIGSSRGISSHQEHPFLALASKNITENVGEVYAMNFVYSGNFAASAELTQFGLVRMSMGIHPDGFEWVLEPGDSFVAPEVVCVYSDKGLGQMTRTFHDLYRDHLIRSPYLHKKRPVLINNWEATYFDFNTERLLTIAEQARAEGVEMLVMDDGWFGRRTDDHSSLGDWQVNEDRLPGGLAVLSKGLKDLGMKFGIWFEPEMVSPDSILRSADISYVKWDMNRRLTDVGGACLGAERQGELYHRYVLGVYELQERLLHEFPELLLENCASGGGRFDAGMLYYSPQIWCSDRGSCKHLSESCQWEGSAL